MIQTRQDRIDRVMALINARPGITLVEVARSLCVSVKSAENWISYARSENLVGWASNDCKKIGWFPLGMVYQAKAIAKERYRTEKNEKRRATRQAMRQEKREARAKAPPKPEPVAVDEVDPGDVPFCRRWGSASAPLPFKCRAPASVFQFRGML